MSILRAADNGRGEGMFALLFDRSSGSKQFVFVKRV